MIHVLAVLAAFGLGFIVWSAIAIGGRKRCPDSFSARELKDWSIEERVGVKHEDGAVILWRPARPGGIFGLKHLRRRIVLAWRVFCGEVDVVCWGEGSGTVKGGENYRDAKAANPFAPPPKGEPVQALRRFSAMGESAPLVGISASFLCGQRQFAITAVDMAGLKYFVKAMGVGIPLQPELCEEILLLPSRFVKNVTEIKPAASKVVPFPGATTEVTQ